MHTTHIFVSFPQPKLHYTCYRYTQKVHTWYMYTHTYIHIDIINQTCSCNLCPLQGIRNPTASKRENTTSFLATLMLIVLASLLLLMHGEQSWRRTLNSELHERKPSRRRKSVTTVFARMIVVFWCAVGLLLY